MQLDGKKVASQIEEKIAQALLSSHRKPGLAFILVGNHPPSQTYVHMKKERCKKVGIVSIDKEFPDSISQEDLVQEILTLNASSEVDGILVQLPLPDHIDPFHIMQTIDPSKDVDGFHPMNMGKLLIGDRSGFIPCTPLGIHTLLTHYQIPLLGKHVVIVGRSNIVGKPLAALLMQKAPHCNATVTIAHSLSQNLNELCQSADILIAATGRAHSITSKMIKPKSVVIDVGIQRLPIPGGGYQIVGDVDFASVAPLASHITPVPGGVGPMTIAMLLSNTLLSYQRKTSHPGHI